MDIGITLRRYKFIGIKIILETSKYIKKCHCLDPYRQYFLPYAFSASYEEKFEITGQ